MSYPILYHSTETQFDHNGLGILGDCAGYRVVTEGNGPYDLTMLYPMDGIHFDEITDRSIIKGKFDKFIEPQLFRVKTISKSMSGNATVYAEHISYDLSGIPVSPFEASDASSALAGLKENAATECPFDFWTDKETKASFNVSAPASIRSRLGGVQGSILDVYGGEYEFDNYTVKLHNNRGMNRGVSIRYGKNLTDIQQEQNCASVATGVYPYWSGAVDGNTVLVELPEKIVNAPGTYNFVKIRTLDLSAEFETQPTVEQLRAKAENYVEANNIGIPDVSLTVSFVQLAQYAEYKSLELLERISLFDTVNVEFPALGVSATAKVVKIVYDGLANRIESITLGSVRTNIADTIAGQEGKMEETAKKEASKAVNGQTSVDIFNRLTDNGRIQGIYIEDNKWYINAEVAKIVNLIAEKLLSESGVSKLRISGAELHMMYNGKETFYINNEFGNDARMGFTVMEESGTVTAEGFYNATHIELGGPGVGDKLLLGVNTSTMTPYMILPNAPTLMLNLEWKDNGDGTYTLIGKK